jgi:hypothetical protein
MKIKNVKLSLCKETVSSLKTKSGIKTERSSPGIVPGFAPCSGGC